MFELIKSGGWLMLPIILCSILAMAIVLERFWNLRRGKIMPSRLPAEVWRLARENRLDNAAIRAIKMSSPLGAILAAGLNNNRHGRDMMRASMEEVGVKIVHELEKYLTTLGTIAMITPLLGLLGTVYGMIKVFSAIMVHGVGDPAVLGGGISEALITTAAGLSVAIPTLIFHRHFERLVDAYVISMEEEALKLIDMLHGDREEDQ